MNKTYNGYDAITHMKNLLVILFMAMITLPAFAQEDEADLPQQQEPKAKEKIQALRVAYITEKLGLTADEAAKFWPVYREYSEKRQTLRHELKSARKNGTPEKDLIDLDLKIKQKELDLEKDYSGRLQKVISAEKLLSLRQAEGDFRKLILRQIQQRQMQNDRRQLRERQQERQQLRNN